MAAAAAAAAPACSSARHSGGFSPLTEGIFLENCALIEAHHDYKPGHMPTLIFLNPRSIVEPSVPMAELQHGQNVKDPSGLWKEFSITPVSALRKLTPRPMVNQNNQTFDSSAASTQQRNKQMGLSLLLLPLSCKPL